MTSNDLLPLLLAAADDVGRVFDYSEVALWPQGSLDEFQRSSLLRPAATGLYAPCPNCDDGHIEAVTIRDGPNQAKRYFIRCPHSMRVEIKPEMCKGWEVDPDGLAQALADAMGLASSPKALVAGRLWRLGRTPWRKSTREVMLALRLMDTDAAAITAHVGPGGRAIVLVPCHPPDERLWHGLVPAVVALSRVATLAPNGIQLDAAAMTEIVSDADALAEAKSEMPVDPEVKKQAVRRQVAAELRSKDWDDIMVAAYKQYQSYRKAARMLTEQTGEPVGKDMVRRAVERRGGIAEIMSNSDSPSVSRTVASQRCDRQKKFAERR